ncbi:MAG: GNAT family N-acetyltransferase, partial [Chitinophagaceae bacterium]
MNKLIVHTERLLIRNLRLSDLVAFHAYRSDPEVTKYQGFDVFSMMQAEDFINAQADKEFGKAGEWVQY